MKEQEASDKIQPYLADEQDIMNHDPVEKGTECCLSDKCLLTNSPEEYSKRRLTLLGTAEKLVFVVHLHLQRLMKMVRMLQQKLVPIQIRINYLNRLKKHLGSSCELL